MTLISFF